MKPYNIVPFKSKFDLVEQSIEHKNFVISKSSGVIYQILKISDELVFFNDAAYDFREFFEKFMWLNGESCGMQERTI